MPIDFRVLVNLMGYHKDTYYFEPSYLETWKSRQVNRNEKGKLKILTNTHIVLVLTSSYYSLQFSFRAWKSRPKEMWNGKDWQVR